MRRRRAKQYQELQRKLTAEGPGERPAAAAVAGVLRGGVDRLREQEKSYILTSGDPLRPEKEHEVKPGWPFATSEPDFRDGRIEAFTDWLTSPENPLFARVAVNRLWQWHFGEGLLKSSSDFGELGGNPSHSALLDWLASEFVQRGFSMKQMHRLMVTSDTYRRASEAGGEYSESQKIDPSGTTLWRFRLQRLGAEPIWDSLHAAAGDLDLKVGGPRSTRCRWRWKSPARAESPTWQHEFEAARCLYDARIFREPRCHAEFSAGV
jgi:hypothetical protein